MEYESNSFSFEKIWTDLENELSSPVVMKMMMKNVLQTTLSVPQSIVPDHDGSRLIRVDSILSSHLRQVFSLSIIST